MTVEPTINKIRITCDKCGEVSVIEWSNVNNSEHAFCDTYGEITCPMCGNIGAVYTREKIDEIKRGKVVDI